MKKVFLICLFSFSILQLFSGCETNKVHNISAQYIALKSPQEIIPITDSLVVPIVYTNAVSLKSLSIVEKKRIFIDFILPGILIERHRMEQEQFLIRNIKKKIEAQIELNREDSILLHDLMTKYHSKHLDELEIRLKTHPTSIVLAQAAIESGWGTSQFFVRANNVFGVWANRKTKEKYKAASSRNGKTIYVRKYQNISHSIRDYYLTIATTKAYRKFRRKRMVISNPYTLSRFLNNYSESGHLYTEKIRTIIKENNLKKFDSYKLDPQFIGLADK